MSQINVDRYVALRIEAWLHRPQPHTATLEIPELGVAVGTTVGQIRKENQDRVIVARLSNLLGIPPSTIFVICDGMGGMVDGSQCAEKTISVLLEYFIQSSLPNIKDRLRASIIASNQEVFQQYHQRGGTTLAVVCRSVDTCIAATVGDTRVYSLSRERPLKQVSLDDTIAGELSRRTGFSTENPQLEPFSNQLAQFIGIGPGLEPRVYDLPCRTDMSYFIASDGAYNIGTAFERILTNAPGVLLAVERIISVSAWMGGKDNATIICIGSDRNESLPKFPETFVELWNATGKFEMILGRCPTVLGRPTWAPVNVIEPVKNGKYYSRNVPTGGKVKTKRSRNEIKGPLPTRPSLEIDFPKPIEQGLKEPQVKDFKE